MAELGTLEVRQDESYLVAFSSEVHGYWGVLGFFRTLAAAKHHRTIILQKHPSIPSKKIKIMPCIDGQATFQEQASLNATLLSEAKTTDTKKEDSHEQEEDSQEEEEHITTLQRDAQRSLYDQHALKTAPQYETAILSHLKMVPDIQVDRLVECPKEVVCADLNVRVDATSFLDVCCDAANRVCGRRPPDLFRVLLHTVKVEQGVLFLHYRWLGH